MEITQVCINKRIKNMWDILKWKLLGHKEEGYSAICSNMDGPRDYHTKWSKSERERQIPYHLYVSETWYKWFTNQFHRHRK